MTYDKCRRAKLYRHQHLQQKKLNELMSVASVAFLGSAEVNCAKASSLRNSLVIYICNSESDENRSMRNNLHLLRKSNLLWILKPLVLLGSLEKIVQDMKVFQQYIDPPLIWSGSDYSPGHCGFRGAANCHCVHVISFARSKCPRSSTGNSAVDNVWVN